MRDIVRYACLAPSVHNTQPWWWRAGSTWLELHADPRRQLAVSDAAGCNLTISCGAALHHAQVAARALGWTPVVTRLPDHEDSHLLARIQLTAAEPPPDASELLMTMRERCTDRRRFTAWPVPSERLHDLAESAAAWRAEVMVISGPTDRLHTELLVGRALDAQAADPGLAEEQRRWVDHSNSDGVPHDVIPTTAVDQQNLRSRYGTGPLTDPERGFKGSDGLLVMHGHTADVDALLRTGEGLSALWLRATTEGLSVVPLSQVVEVEATREQLRLSVLHGHGVPHLLVRIGWQAIGRAAITRTPRRPLKDVLTM